MGRERRGSDAEFDAREERSNVRFQERHRKMTKTVMAAVSLFTLGSVMLWLGVKNLGVDQERAIAMLVVGSLAFLPGSYASWNLFGAWRRWAGYSYDAIPSYDDD